MKSVGTFTISPGFKYRVEDDNGKECAVGSTGEIVVFSPLRMLNYMEDRNNDPVTWVSQYFVETKRHSFVLDSFSANQ